MSSCRLIRGESGSDDADLPTYRQCAVTSADIGLSALFVRPRTSHTLKFASSSLQDGGG